MTEQIFGDNPENLIPMEITGLEYLITTIGPDLVAQAVEMPADTSVPDIKCKIMRIEGFTMAGLEDMYGSTYRLLDKLGRETLSSALSLEPDVPDDTLRAAIRELDRRSSVTELGLEPDATQDDIFHAKENLHRQAMAKELGLSSGAPYEEITHAREAATFGLPPTATKEEVAVARGLAAANDWANTDHKLAAPIPEKRSGEGWDEWMDRNTY